MRESDQYFTVSEFAELFNIHKKTLYHYDRIGLFKPEYVSENGYRYYSHEQTYDFHVLLALRDMQMSLMDTKNYVHNRTPESMIELMDYKVNELEEQIQKLSQLKLSIARRLELIKSTVNVPIEDIQVMAVAEEYLRLEPIEVRDGHDTNYMTWHRIFCENERHQLNEGAYGQVLLQENLIRRYYSPDYILIEAIEPEDKKHAFVKPAGNYVIGRKNGKVLHSEALYHRLMDYIETHNLEIIGNAYEFFIIDGSFASDVNNRVLEIQIQVK